MKYTIAKTMVAGLMLPVLASTAFAGLQFEKDVYAARRDRDHVLADRALSRLLESDWPATIEELDELRSS